MDCCSVQDTNKFFSHWSRTYLKRFRRKGLAKEQKFLVQGITQASLHDKTILEIGSGIGSLHLNLLQQGAISAVGVDIAEGMIEKARSLATDLGLEARTRYYVGDFVTMNGEIPESDITILDKVVCCYEEVDKLFEKSIAKTKEIYALSFPRDTLVIKFLFKTQIVVSTLFRFSFRPYWHNWEGICQKVLSHNFDEIYRNKTIIWTIRVYQKRHD